MDTEGRDLDVFPKDVLKSFSGKHRGEVTSVNFGRHPHTTLSKMPLPLTWVDDH